MTQHLDPPTPTALRGATKAAALPPQLFFSTPEQRLSLARQRFFDEGTRPSGLVSEAIIQSWTRCVQARRKPGEALSFNPVTASRVQTALAQSRLLLETAASELNQLHHTLAGTACTVILTDPQGVVVHAAWAGAHADESLLPLARRVGVNLAEGSIGTNAPGVTVRSGQASTVLGGEHFFGVVQALHCAAAPIRDVHGRVAGVLDVSSESRPFGFDAAAVVGMVATSIENRLLQAQSSEHIVVHLQTSPALLGTPMEGLVGIAADGGVAWVNNAGARLLGLQGPAAALSACEVFGLALGRLMALTRHPGAFPHRLPSGLNLWLVARFQRCAGEREVFSLGAVHHDAAFAAPPVELPAVPVVAESTLRESDRHLIGQTLRACGGNVSKAARQLGVSRGLVYRHLRRVAPAP